MKEIVTKHVKGCVLCSTCKPTNRKLGLYTPLPVPSHPWESISMDFVGALHVSKRGHDYLYCWVCVIFFACVCVGVSDMTTAFDDPSY
jgi:hypothetical protein